MLPTKDEEKPTCKCKKCGKVYIAAGAYDIGNLKRHLKVCPRKDTMDVGQLILGQNAMNYLSSLLSMLVYGQYFHTCVLMSLISLEILLRMIWLRCIRGKKKG